MSDVQSRDAEGPDGVRDMTGMPEVTSQQLLKAFGGLLRNFAAVIIAMLVIWNFGMPIVSPLVNAKIELMLAPINGQIANMRVQLAAQNTQMQVQLAAQSADTRTKLDAISSRLGLGDPPPFLQVFGAGLLANHGPFFAGGSVRVLFLVQRLQPCASTLQVRFLDEKGQIDTSLTYSRIATRAPVTTEPLPFVATIRLPEEMQPGLYSYSPIIEPDQTQCPGAKAVTLVPSEYFEVVGPPIASK